MQECSTFPLIFPLLQLAWSVESRTLLVGHIIFENKSVLSKHLLVINNDDGTLLMKKIDIQNYYKHLSTDSLSQRLSRLISSILNYVPSSLDWTMDYSSGRTSRMFLAYIGSSAAKPFFTENVQNWTWFNNTTRWLYQQHNHLTISTFN